MKKGMFFSTDAVLALILVMSLAAWLPQQLNAEEEQGSAFEKLEEKALDRAIIGFYKGMPSDAPNFESKDFGKCIKVYDISPINSLGTRDLQSRQFCRVA